MKFHARVCVLLSLCIAVLCSPAYADGFEITSVDFYPSGAKITLQVQSDGRFAFELPGAYDMNSVRCLNAEQVTSVKTENIYLGNETPPELESAQSRIDEATRTISLIEGRKSALEQTKAILQAPYSFQNGNWSVSLSADDVINYAARAEKIRLDTESTLADIDMELTRARKDLEKTLKEFQDIEKSLTEKRGSNPENAVSIRGTTNGRTSLTFEAFTPHAGWNTAYEMKLNSLSGGINAVLNATAWQSTGMSLDGAFSFHTRAPSQSVSAPNVLPYTVGLQEKIQTSGRAVPARAANIPGYNMAADSAIERYAGPLNQSPELKAISTLTDVSVTGSGSVGGDGAPVRVKLGEFSLESTPELIAIPEQNREAWVVASIDVIPESFLPGEAELFVDGAASGRTNIEESAATARIAFGMSPRILSKKTRFVPESGSSWMGSGTFRDGYTLEVTNGMGMEREVTVMDRIPVSVVDSVSVNIEAMDPQPEQDKEGRLTWKIKLAPGETKKITVRYAIRYPRGETLQYGTMAQ